MARMPDTAAMLRPRNIALLYALFASLAVLLLASTMPPLQNADEGSHTLRADQISHFSVLPHKSANGVTGGTINSGLVTLGNSVRPLMFHRDHKVTRDMYVALPWGPPAFAEFSNTVIYPPFFYLPAAAAMVLARLAAIPLPHALVMVRVATGMTTVALCTLAIALSGNAAIWLFAILLLPMSMALTAGVTQDGPMLASVALGVALSLHLRAPQAGRRLTAFCALCLLLALVGMARPPYAAFALVIFSARVPLAWRLAGFGTVLACVVGWDAANAAFVVLPRPPDGVVDPGLQLQYLSQHLGHWLSLLTTTWNQRGDFATLGFIGYLGWLDVDLPKFYHGLAWFGLALAGLASWRAGTGRIPRFDASLAVAAAFGACAGVELIQYLTWTVVGAPVIEGIQGRYFLAPALLLGLLLARPAAPSSRSAIWLAVPVLAFPVISIAVTMHALLVRYYF
jgi:hypothetical protein